MIELRPLAKIALLTFAACAVSPAAWAAEKDSEGCVDPGIKRFAGSHIRWCSTGGYIEYTLPTGKKKGDSFERKEELEGKIVALNYTTAPGVSSLEVFRNYTKTLTGSGFKILFEAKKDDAKDLNEEMFSKKKGVCFSDEPYYAAAVHEANGLKTYVALWVARATNDEVEVCLDKLTAEKMNLEQMSNTPGAK